MKRLVLLLSLFLFLSTQAWAATRVGIVFDAGGKFDRSFNQSAWEGTLKAKKELGIKLKDVEPGDTSAVKEAMRTFAADKYDLIIAVGFLNADALKEVAKEFPKVNFALVDAVVDLPNVASLVFNEHEGSYLTGMLAAMRSRQVNGKRAIGFIGGMDIPLIHKFEAGYRQGAKAIYKNIKVMATYVGNTPNAWNDPTKAKEIANAQMAKGASVIYAAAGASGNGMFDAIKEMNGRGPCYPKVKAGKRIDKCVYAVGVDSNQNYIIPGQVLTSMLKRVDVSVFETIKKVNNNTFKAGLNVFGLDNNGVGYAVDKYNRKLVNKKMKRVVDSFRKKIIQGKITVKTK